LNFGQANSRPPPDTIPPRGEVLRAEDQARNREAIKRALDFYLCPEPAKPRRPSTMFMVCPEVDTESLLAHACESLASASAATSNFANELTGLQRSTALGIQQIIMLAELAVNRALDRVDPQT
jgi:hypothetical protein